MDDSLDECLTNVVAWLDRAAVAAVIRGADHDTAAMLRYLREKSEACRLSAIAGKIPATMAAA